jgi:hypothetical protein
MDPILQSLLPVGTLILGYFLNVWVGSIESGREVKRRRIAEKEKAYARILAKLHELFEEYRLQTLRTTTQTAGYRMFGEPDENVIPAHYADLEKIVYENSLYLRPSIIQALVDLKLTDFRTRVQHTSRGRDETQAERIQSLEQHADAMWVKAKAIISDMRKELGLEEYPKDLLRMWR